MSGKRNIEKKIRIMTIIISTEDNMCWSKVGWILAGKKRKQSDLDRGAVADGVSRPTSAPLRTQVWIKAHLPNATSVGTTSSANARGEAGPPKFGPRRRIGRHTLGWGERRQTFLLRDSELHNPLKRHGSRTNSALFITRYKGVVMWPSITVQAHTQ